VVSNFNWYLDCVVHFDRPDTLTVHNGIERATTDLHPIALCVRLRVADIFSLRSVNTALPAGVGRQDPADQIQVEDQGDDEYQAPPVTGGAKHNDDDGDPNCQ
jgi:hypothetical protein